MLSVAVLATVVQAQNPRGSLRGTVQDSSGARVASAKIVLQAVDSSVRREASSEDRGEFRLDDVLPGAYRITVSANGFAPAESDVAIAVATVREVTVTLKPAAAPATVNVQGQASSITTQPIDLASVVHQGVVGTRDLENLPLAARSFANIAYLAPGTEPVEPSDPTKARITAVSTGGSSGLNNDLSVDGGDNSDDWIGGFLQNFSPEAIQEFAVRTANEDADTGGTTAGSVVITTKRGTNEWHGSGAFYERAASLNARFPIENPAPNPKQPFSRQNYVGTIGGPLAHDKVWFFSSLEYVRENASIAYSPSSTAEFTALSQIAADGLIPGVSSIAVPANVPIPFRDFLGSVRFDWAQSPNSQWFLRTSDRQLPDAQQSGSPGHSALDRIDHAQQLLEHRHQQHLRVQSHVAGHIRLRRQPAASDPDPHLYAWLRARLPVQRNLADRVGIRNLRRQPVRHSHHFLPVVAQSAEIPTPL